MQLVGNSSLIEPGDRIYYWADWKKHYGVYAGNGWVWHNAPTKGEHYAQLEAFSGGRRVHIDRKCPAVDRYKVLSAIQAKAGNPEGYDLLSYNCEHAARQLTEGSRISYQVLGWGVFGLALCGLLYVALTEEA